MLQPKRVFGMKCRINRVKCISKFLRPGGWYNTAGENSMYELLKTIHELRALVNQRVKTPPAMLYIC
jgi:hypothetical protein